VLAAMARFLTVILSKDYNTCQCLYYVAGEIFHDLTEKTYAMLSEVNSVKVLPYVRPSVV